MQFNPYSISRILSIVIALAYMKPVYSNQGVKGVFWACILLILPLTCIWFGDKLGFLTGPYNGVSSRSQATGREGSGCFVPFIGWALLLLPGFIMTMIL